MWATACEKVCSGTKTRGGASERGRQREGLRGSSQTGNKGARPLVSSPSLVTSTLVSDGTTSILERGFRPSTLFKTAETRRGATDG